MELVYLMGLCCLFIVVCVSGVGLCKFGVCAWGVFNACVLFCVVGGVVGL